MSIFLGYMCVSLCVRNVLLVLALLGQYHADGEVCDSRIEPIQRIKCTRQGSIYI